MLESDSSRTVTIASQSFSFQTLFYSLCLTTLNSVLFQVSMILSSSACRKNSCVAVVEMCTTSSCFSPTSNQTSSPSVNYLSSRANSESSIRRVYLISSQWMSFNFGFPRAVTIGIVELKSRTILASLTTAELSGSRVSHFVTLRRYSSDKAVISSTAISANTTDVQVATRSAQSLSEYQSSLRIQCAQ